MATKTFNVKQIQRKDTAANWTSTNPVLSTGEIGFESDTGKFKIGDGTTAWTSLIYAVPVTSVNGQTGDVTVAAGGAVTSVNNKTGAVTLTKSDVGLGNVDNTADSSKSVYDSARLGGSLPSAFAPNPTVLQGFGQIVYGRYVRGYGTVVARQITDNGIYEIHAECQLTTIPTSSTNDVYWGFSATHISNILGINFDVNTSGLQKRGTWKAFKSDGTLRRYVDYGTCFQWITYGAYTYLLPSRFYTTDGSDGGWQSQAFGVGDFLEATLYLQKV